VVCKTLFKTVGICFTRSYADYSLFTYNNGGKFMALLVYMDDIVLTGNDSKLYDDLKVYLDKCFQIKDLKALKYFFGH